MTEVIIITAIIVSGIVALAWTLLHFAFKAWRTERILQHDAELDGPRPDWFKPADLN